MTWAVFYTDRLVPKGFAGWAAGPVILIRPRYKDDVGLLEHEKVHARQFWRLPVLHGLLYFLSRRYRLKAEVEAYREQLKWYEDDRARIFATSIATKYRVKVTVDEAEAMLRTA